MEKILVTGSTGKVGRALIEELVRTGEDVRAATRNLAGFSRLDRVEPMRFDYTDPNTFDAALEGVNRVFLMEPQPSLGAAHKVMIPFVEAAARGMRKIVLMSSLSVEFDVREPLRQVEFALERSGAPFVILRPNWFMDNFHTWWIEPIKQAGIIPLPAAGSRSAFIDSRDIGEAAAAAIRSDRFNGRTFALTGPESLGYEDAAAILSKMTGRAIQYVPVDDASFTQSLVDAGLPDDHAHYVTGLFRHTRAGLAAKPSSAVEELTARAPRRLAQYAQDHASAWV
jgi:uncharacterized protein YbjT (DUF2867 family)